MYRGVVFLSGISIVHIVPCWNILIGLGLVELHELCGWEVLDDERGYGNIDLRELQRWKVRGHFRGDLGCGLSDVRRRQVLGSRRKHLLKLRLWNLRGRQRLRELHGLFLRVLLGLDCGDCFHRLHCLCRREVLCRGRWIVHELRCWDLSVRVWPVELPELPERRIVDHHRIDGIVELRDLHLRQVHRHRGLHELCGGVVPTIVRDDRVRVMRGGHGFVDCGCDGVERVRGMHEREVRRGGVRGLLELRRRDVPWQRQRIVVHRLCSGHGVGDDRRDGLDRMRELCRREVLGRRGGCMRELCGWNLCLCSSIVVLHGVSIGFLLVFNWSNRKYLLHLVSWWVLFFNDWGRTMHKLCGGYLLNGHRCNFVGCLHHLPCRHLFLGFRRLLH